MLSMNSLSMFWREFCALFHKTYLLAKRKRGETITEILLAYTFLALLLGMRYILDRRYNHAYQIPRFRPQDAMTFSNKDNITFYYPSNPCTDQIVNSFMTKLKLNWPMFNSTMQYLSNPDVSSLPVATQLQIHAFIYFTNLNSCTNATTMPDQITYTLRMQEYGATYYRAQRTMLLDNDIFWKRAPEDFCQSNASMLNYQTAFLGVQYFIDLAIIEYSIGIPMIDYSNIHLNHFGCPEYYFDQLHSLYNFFIPIFFSFIYLITFMMNIGYIVDERQNKTKEYLRIFGLRTWINNLVWVCRAMSLLAKLIAFLLWVITFIDFYPGVSVGVRYFMSLFPNSGLLFCFEVVLQFERKSYGVTTYKKFYTNLYTYPLYIGIILLIQCLWSVIFMLLAIYVERINPGEFGVAQPWTYLFRVCLTTYL
ncbi:unnamed protein product [Didymodactylos carnosus]|uniref:Uncharacterized protein n=1 Tax=Didymodactylos carnosus TaxID=1234261 RepID=A0A814IND7_9BILA|nr:unnamed protein product [Didymodactylos carnosus]CAF3797675.1 unnamed protein product [Didymodactylos carnosus]